jgi:hypothetical protein
MPGDAMKDAVVRELKEADWNRWDEWLALQPWGSPFSAAWWLDASCRAFGGHPLILGVHVGEQLSGGVALRIADVASLHVVRPSMIYNPIVMAEGPTQTTQQALKALLREIALRGLIVRPLKSTPNVVDLREGVWDHWDLTASWTAVTALTSWNLERDTSRTKLQQLRKSRSAGNVASVEPGNPDLLYDLVRETILRHGHEPSLTRRQMAILVEGAGAHGIQTVARGADGTPLSAGFTMWHGAHTAYDIWCGTSATGLARGAAVARYVCLLQELQAGGYEYYDWCDTTLPGYSDFKLEFGGEMMPCLSIARQPRWLKSATLIREHLSKMTGALRRHGK